MPSSWRKLLSGLLLFLSTGAAVGWMYGRPEVGLLVTALIALVWQVRQLLAFDRALRSRDFSAFRQGDGIWQQIFSRFRYERQKSDRNKDRYRDLLREIRKSTDAMPDAAVIVNMDNEILMCNRAAKQLVGLRPKKDKGQRVDNIIRNKSLSKLLDSDDATLTVDIASPARAGDWLNCRVVPYGADQKLLLFRDVTERLRLGKMRRDFVANASHELRSPLTVITGYLDGLTPDEIPDSLQRPFAEMQSQARRMNQVVSELLQLSRLESAGRAGTENAVDVARLMHAIAASFGKKSATAIQVEADPSVQLLGNETQIESVITNFVSNAIRYTDQDDEICLRWKRRKNGAILEVEDTGEGIAPEHIPRLTERFFRVDRGRAREEGGVGLGLAIVKHIVNRHDAELQVESEPGQGSTFRCVFGKDRVQAAPRDILADDNESRKAAG